MQQQFTNDLIHESSLYLLQHAHNPVNWHTWSEKSIQLAKDQDKPILVSIGYAACHWCHVMERESFENIDIANFMNEHFINIKIDREERPDLDGIYMDAVQILTGSGGWPLNVFLTSEGKPFFGGTYFPIERKYNRPTWMDVLHFIKDAWVNKRNQVEQQAKDLLNHIEAVNHSLSKQAATNNSLKDDEVFTKSFCEELHKQMLKNADYTNGGFGIAPKFPQTFSIEFLLTYGHIFDNKQSIQHALFSLKSILRGGIFDHLGGGICRYSTDEKWLVPHFEKMLYDNALLVITLCAGYQISKDEELKIGAEKILSFCEKEMSDSNGGYYAAIDADSEGVEGKFYVWALSEIELILREDAPLFCEWYGVTTAGNWEGKNILNIQNDRADFLQKNNLTDEAFTKLLNDAENRLLKERDKKIRPATDDKILLGWNSLLLIAFCKAAGAFKNDEYTKKAIKLYDFIIEKFSSSELNLFHSYKKGLAKQQAYLDDYAYFIQASIYLQEISGDMQYLLKAKSLTDYLNEYFRKEKSDFYYYTSELQSDLILRKVEVNDAALPSGNSTMAFNLYYLSCVFDNPKWAVQSQNMLMRMMPLAEKHPNSFGCWSLQMLLETTGYFQIVLAGKNNTALKSELLELFIPNKIFQSAESESDFPLLEGKQIPEKSLIYVCKTSHCLTPSDNIKEVKILTKN